MNGVIRVDEDLYGDRVPREIKFRFVCKWDALCQRRPPPAIRRCAWNEDFGSSAVP